MDRFNRVFQKSNENTTCQLYTEMSRLVKLYAANILTADSIKKVGDDLKKLSFAEGDQLDRENLGIGTDTWTSVAVLEEEHDTKPFFDAVREFYVNTIKKMIKKFPFGDTILQDLGILVPEKASSYPANTIIRLAKRFPQLELSDSNSLDQLREEFLDYTLSPMDLPTQEQYIPIIKPYQDLDK